MARRYAIYDVFTERRLAGNPLAVVFEAEGLAEEAMQAIAQEFNLSETVFILRPGNAAHSARLRIFTPAHELPFAGHPTVGAAVAIAEAAYGEANSALELMQVLEESVGPVRAAVRLKPGAATFAEFDLPRKPIRLHAQLDRQEIADALALKTTQVGFENHVPSFWSAGVPFVMIPLRDVGAAASVEFDPQRWEHLAPLPKAGSRQPISTVAAASTIQPAFMPGCSPRAWASPRTRRPARPWPLFPAPSTSSTAWSTAIIRC